MAALVEFPRMQSSGWPLSPSTTFDFLEGCKGPGEIWVRHFPARTGLAACFSAHTRPGAALGTRPACTALSPALALRGSGFAVSKLSKTFLCVFLAQGGLSKGTTASASSRVYPRFCDSSMDSRQDS